MIRSDIDNLCFLASLISFDFSGGVSLASILLVLPFLCGVIILSLIILASVFRGFFCKGMLPLCPYKVNDLWGFGRVVCRAWGFVPSYTKSASFS
jgi:hypothetical protein